MAVIDWEMMDPPAGMDYPTGVRYFRWPKTGTTFASTDTGKPLECGEFERKTVQTVGAFNGATVSLEGSVDPDPATATFGPVSDQGGTAIAFTAAGIKTILQDVALLRPNVTAATPTSLTVIVRLQTAARR